ncbi:MAG: hypothetical protein IE910_10735 [Brevundimonas sp.]|nr:hypothetical protein [Brevundimonas sp.]
MSRDPKSQAREVALAHGSAAEALNVLGPIGGADEGELRHQLYQLQSLENGVAVADCQKIVDVAKGEALPAWTKRRDDTQRAADLWKRDLLICKAAMFTTVAARWRSSSAPASTSSTASPWWMTLAAFKSSPNTTLLNRRWPPSCWPVLRRRAPI